MRNAANPEVAALLYALNQKFGQYLRYLFDSHRRNRHLHHKYLQVLIAKIRPIACILVATLQPSNWSDEARCNVGWAPAFIRARVLPHSLHLTASLWLPASQP